MTLPVRFSFRYFFLTDVFGWVGARSDVGPVVERCTMGPKDLGSNPTNLKFFKATKVKPKCEKFNNIHFALVTKIKFYK